MLVKMLYFGGIINKKNLFIHELGSKFFFLGSLAYQLVNILVFEEKNHVKWVRTGFFSSIIGLGLNFTYEFEVCFSVHCTMK